MRKKNSLHYSFSIQIILFVLSFLWLTACSTSKNSSSLNPEKRLSLKKGKQTLSSKKKLEFEYYFFTANKEKIIGNYEEAAKLYLSALDAYPKSSAALYELGSILLQSQKLTHALYYSKKALEIEPDNYWYRLLYIDCLRESGNWIEVANIYKKLLKQNPENIENYYELSNAYLFMGRANDAIKIYDDFEKQFGFNAEIALQKIKVNQAIKNYDAAIKEAQRLVERFPKSANFYGILGDVLKNAGKNQQALEAYEKMVEIAPDDPYAHISLADYYRDQKQNDKAFVEIKEAFKSPELDIDTKVKMLLSYYYMTEEYEEYRAEAYELCIIATEVHSDNPKAYAVYGDFLFRDDKFVEAGKQYRKSIELDNEKYAVWSQLMMIDSKLNEYVELEKDSRTAMELFPTQPFPYFFNGISNIQLKNYRIALSSLEIGKDYVIDNPALLAEFYGYIGEAHNYLKNYAESDVAYDKSIGIISNNPVVLNNYAYYLSLRNEHLEKAEKMSRKSNEINPNNPSYEDTYAWVLYKMGNFKDAKIWIEKAIEHIGKDNGTLLEHYGDILYKLGEIDKAVDNWEKAKKVGDVSEFIDKKIAEKKFYE